MYSAQNIRYTYITDIRCLYKYLQFYILSWNFINQGFMMYVWCRQKKHNEIFTELSWFRKWFLLREHTFCFYTNPGLLNSAGCASEDSFETVSEPRYQARILLEDILTVPGRDQHSEHLPRKLSPKDSFEVYTPFLLLAVTYYVLFARYNLWFCARNSSDILSKYPWHQGCGKWPSTGPVEA